jgi:acetyl esterase
MDDAAIEPNSGPGNGIDPEVRRFAAQLTADYARLTDGRLLDPAEMRQVAEAVRVPWRAGGPTMARTVEHQLATEAGPVRVRIHDPGVAAAAPALIYLHGGGWTMFSLDTHDRVMREYAARAGVVVVGVDYALSPEARYPIALRQIIGVVRALGERGPQLGLDSARMALGGDSAGGNLSICAALALRDAGETTRIAGLLLIYPCFDRECSAESRRRYGGPGAVLTGEEVDYFWRNYVGDLDVRDEPLACPLRARFEGLPPVCLTIPECDVLTEQSLEAAKRLRAAGVSVDLTVYPGATHSFIEAMSIAPVADRAISDGARWISRVLASKVGRPSR